ncbi:hypothetical protein KVR01_006139 [Diaporthe batatas]|uniref:uncharacterized protein n=1 Tax=Diaporthe batatas TaxID=748121 RepID=UPI001D05B3F9|nr:uncharacterized protein KVR01_006139 [Diaporthe batatas]KAG8164221.1 hypothetical protein KVR01_006139 [Diaporthe batatas]
MISPVQAAGVLGSRQKNCNSCVQMKRRCDRRTPVCTRCAERKVPCVYGNAKASHRTGNQGRQSHSHIEALHFDSPDVSLFDIDTPFEIGCLDSLTVPTRPDSPGHASQTIPNAFVGEDASIDAFMDFVVDENPHPPQRWLVPANENLTIERPGTPADEEIMTSYQKMASFCDDVKPWHLYDPKSPLHSTVNRVKAFTKDMATQNCAPFLHRYLYRIQTPQAILTCFTTCVLYDNRTPANTAMVMRALYGNVRELLDSEIGRTTVTPTERLARTQALFIYQVIRLFDENITLRSQAEKDMPVLQGWLAELCKIRDNLGNLETDTARHQNSVEWERWIFAESVRRTIVMAYSVIVLYEMMKDSENDDDDTGAWAYTHRWTLSRPLWEASSSFEFSRLWKETPHFIISNYSFDSFLKHGRGEDVDDFAEILMTVYMGVDETKEFISTRSTQKLGKC